MHKLAQSVLGYVRKHDLLRAGDRVGVAVSGGADSVGLLRILLELRTELGIVLSVVHLNHKLRAEESDADEAFVRELAVTQGLEFICESCDVKSYAAEKKLSLEAAAREVRYEFFGNLLAERRLNKVTTAHTIDDQAETVLLRLIRGSGFRGLGGIRRSLPFMDVAEEPCGEVVRPLLTTRRSVLRGYLVDAKQHWREDSSNTQKKFARNRVRQLLMPVLEKEFNPAIAEKLAELAEIAQGEEEYWIGERNSFYGKLVRVSNPEWANFYVGIGSSQGEPRTPPEPSVLKKIKQVGPAIINLALDLREFNALALGARRRVIQSLENFGMPLEFTNIDEIVDIASDENAQGKEIRLPWGWRAIRTAEELQFLTADLRTEERIPSSYEYQLAVPGVVTVWEAGVVVEAALVEGQFEELLDPNGLSENLIVRNWHAGERFWPAHTKEPKKIKELLQDRHITGDEKKRWPVVVSGDEIVWVRGLGVRRDLQAKDGKGVLIQESGVSGG